MCSLIIIGATICASIDLRDNSRQWLVVPARAHGTDGRHHGGLFQKACTNFVYFGDLSAISIWNPTRPQGESGW
jgi:hypothetical protein